jgi:hypothetical protein
MVLQEKNLNANNVFHQEQLKCLFQRTLCLLYVINAEIKPISNKCPFLTHSKKPRKINKQMIKIFLILKIFQRQIIK